MGRNSKLNRLSAAQPATTLAASDINGAPLTSNRRALMRLGDSVVRNVEDATRAQAAAADKLADGMVDVLALAVQRIQAKRAAAHASTDAASPSAPGPQAMTALHLSQESRARVAQAVKNALLPPPPDGQEAEAMRAAIDEVLQLNAMYVAFTHTASGQLDVLEEVLRAQPHETAEALTEAYPSQTRAAYKQAHARLGRCKSTALLFRSMLATDRRTLISARDALDACTAPLEKVMPHLRDEDLKMTLHQAFGHLNRVMRTLRDDLLHESLISFWNRDLQRESRRLLPSIVTMQLDALDPYLTESVKRDRIRIPNMDHFVEASALPKPRPRTNTLADLIASDGPRFLQSRAEAAQKAQEREQARVAARESARVSVIPSAASHVEDMSASEANASDDEDIHRLQKLPQPIVTRKKNNQPRRLRFAKQQAPNAVSSAPDTSASASTSTEAALGRHKAKHRSERVLPEADATGGDASPVPKIHLSRTGADILHRLMATSYQQKVKKDEYQRLLREFVEANGPQGTGYLKSVRQPSSGPRQGAVESLQFTNSHEHIWFQRYDGRWVSHSFHYPHGRDSNVALPKEMLHDYRNVFNAFEVLEAGEDADSARLIQN